MTVLQGQGDGIVGERILVYATSAKTIVLANNSTRTAPKMARFCNRFPSNKPSPFHGIKSCGEIFYKTNLISSSCRMEFFKRNAMLFIVNGSYAAHFLAKNFLVSSATITIPARHSRNTQSLTPRKVVPKACCRNGT